MIICFSKISSSGKIEISADTEAEKELLFSIYRFFNSSDETLDLRIKSLEHGKNFMFSLNESTENDTSMFTSVGAIKIIQTKFFNDPRLKGE